MPRKFTYFNKTKPCIIKYPEMQEDYVSYETKLVKKSTGPGIDDFELEQIVEEHKTNIKEFINSFNGEVGIDNILAKFKQTGDISLFNQVEEIHGDTTFIPEDPGEKFAQAEKWKTAFEAIDPELRGEMNMEEFIESLSMDKIQAYIDKKIEKLNPKKEGE